GSKGGREAIRAKNRRNLAVTLGAGAAPPGACAEGRHEQGKARFVSINPQQFASRKRAAHLRGGERFVFAWSHTTPIGSGLTPMRVGPRLLASARELEAAWA